MTDEKRCEDGEFHSATFTYCSAYSQDHPHPNYAADDEAFQDLWSGYFDSCDRENQVLNYVSFRDFGGIKVKSFSYKDY